MTVDNNIGTHLMSLFSNTNCNYCTRVLEEIKFGGKKFGGGSII